MKFQFTTEGSKPQTKYHCVEICSADQKEGVLFSACVSTPLDKDELFEVLENRLHANKYASEELMSINIVSSFDTKPSSWVYDFNIIHQASQAEGCYLHLWRKEDL